MRKKYKNLTKGININLYGYGDIHIPQGEFEEDDLIVNAIQKMTPVKLFEELKYVPATVEDGYETMTVSTLQRTCRERKVAYTSKDTKVVLISKLRGE